MNAHLIRTPEVGDGYAINRLVSRCPPLDRNSIYANGWLFLKKKSRHPYHVWDVAVVRSLIR